MKYLVVLFLLAGCFPSTEDELREPPSNIDYSGTIADPQRALNELSLWMAEQGFGLPTKADTGWSDGSVSFERILLDRHIPFAHPVFVPWHRITITIAYNNVTDRLMFMYLEHRFPAGVDKMSYPMQLAYRDLIDDSQGHGIFAGIGTRTANNAVNALTTLGYHTDTEITTAAGVLQIEIDGGSNTDELSGDETAWLEMSVKYLSNKSINPLR